MAAISKEEYLKRYLSGDTSAEKKKKRKKVKAVKHPKSKIIDDDIDLKTIGSSATIEQEESEDEAPTVAEFVDERPDHVKRLEEYRKDQRWKVLGQKEKHDLASDYGVMTLGNKHSQHDVDSDTSPPRKKRHDSDSDTSLPRKKRYDSDSDESPPRKNRHDSDSDASPPRKKRHDSDSDISPPRRKHQNSDVSLPQKKRHDSNGDFSSSRRKKQHDSDVSPPRRKRHDSDSDASPPRKRRHDLDSGNSPTRPKWQGGNLDYSSPKPEMGSDKNTSKRHERKRPSRFAPAETSRHDSDSDQSPQRRQKHDSGSDPSPPRRQGHDSDQSPKRKQRHDSDSDQSPPRQRKRGTEGDKSSRKREGGRDAKPDKTLGGAKAGLSSAAEMRDEAAKLRKKEEENFSKIDREALGREATTVFRDKSGKRRNLAAEKEEEEKDAQKKAVEDKKYEEWGQGLKQKELREQAMENYVHEASKPLARYKDDQDLDRIMREMERDGDPMAMFLKKKKAKKEDPANEKPRYRGPLPPPNRFQIMPGYRWDGVDRTNGFEKQIFSKMSEKKAVKEHAYKWSTEDM